MMGIAALHPSYSLFLHTMSFAAINPPPAISTAAIAIVAVGCAKPARIRNAVDSKRRRVGRGAEHADIAALHADVPDKERGTHRADAERNDREPLPDRFGPDGGLNQAMHECGQQRGGETEAGHRIGRHRLSLRDITE